MNQPVPSSRPSPPGSRIFGWKNFLVVLLIIAAVFSIYGPALHGAFIGDDVWYLLRNPVLHDPAQFWRIWFDPGSWVEFYPLEESVLYLEWHLWQADPFGYHLVNVSLHVLNALLVWHLLRKLNLEFAWLGALIFAVHPELVDSVAQVAELKNTLSFAPFILALCFYLDYDRTGMRRSYLRALAAFLAAMLCKITMAPFPFLILLFVWWKHDRIQWKDVVPTIPFFLISLALGMTTIWAGEVYGHAIAHDWRGGVDSSGGVFFRIVLAGQTLLYYFSRCIWPFHPVIVYPRWIVNPSHPAQWIPWIIIGAVLAWCWRKREGWGRHALLGLGFFTIFLAPFLGLHPITYLRLTWILDHMLYLPIVGLIGLFVAAWADLHRKIPVSLRLGPALILGVCLIFWGIQSRVYAGKFTSAEVLDRYALSLYPDNDVLHQFLGGALQDKGDNLAAIREFQIALRAHGPDEPAGNAPVHAQLGDLYLQVHRFPEAGAEYHRAREMDYQPVEMMVNEGTVLMYEGKIQSGIGLLNKAVATDPASPMAQYNLAKALCLTGQVNLGIDAYRKAIQLQPNYAEAHNNLGIIFARQGRTPEALREFQLALAANPRFADAARNLQIVQAASSSPAAAR